MLILSLAMQKGGSGKTTTAINLAAAWQRAGYRVLLVDLDPQSNLTQALGIPEDHEPSIYHLFRQEASGRHAEPRTAILNMEHVPLIPANLDLASAELELVSCYGREQFLSRMLRSLREEYDFGLIDCPPAIGMLTVNALVASDYVLMPLQAEFLPWRGVQSFMHHFNTIKRNLNPKLEVLGIMLTKYDQRKTMNREVLEQLQETYGADKVLETKIRTNIALAQAQERGMDIFQFQKNANGAEDYYLLAQEILQKLQLKPQKG